MKRTISIILSIAIILSCTSFTCFAYDKPQSTESFAGPSYEELVELFPEVSLGKDGYLTDTRHSTALPKCFTDPEEPVRSYTADIDTNTSCQLLIYSDGSYATTGIEEVNEDTITVSTVSSTGSYGYSTVSSTKIKSYWNYYAVYYSLYYYITYSKNSTTGYVTISSITDPSMNWINAPYTTYMSARAKSITRASETSSAAASAYASATVYVEGVASYVMKLTTSFRSSSISVSGTYSIP